MVKNPPANAGGIEMRVRSLGKKIPWRVPGNPLQYSCMEYPMDRGAWHATVPRITKSWTLLKHLSMHTSLLSWFFTRVGECSKDVLALPVVVMSPAVGSQAHSPTHTSLTLGRSF